MSRRGQATARDALESALANLESATRLRENVAMAWWDRVVGPQASAASAPESVRDGVLIVHTKSSVWSQELAFMRAHIMAQLNRRVGQAVIREIVFRPHGVNRDMLQLPEPAGPTEQELEAAMLTADDIAALTTEIVALDSIPDPGIRCAVERRLAREKRLAVWRRAHGWKSCVRCGDLHSSGDALCPCCRVSP